jgi:hypothetical protein
MRTRTVAIVVALGVLVALAVPGGAVAKSRFYNTPGSTSEEIQLLGTHGYRVSLEVYDRQAQLDVDKRVGHQGLISVYYRLHRRLPAGPDIRFQLGKEGYVDLRFVSDRVVENEYPNCSGGPEITEHGHFLGTIRFLGRRDFSRVDAHRVDGLVTRTPPHRCRREKSSNGQSFGVGVGVGVGTGTPSVPKGAFELIAGTPDRRLNFVGYRFEESGLPGVEDNDFDSFEAGIARKQPTFSVTSSAFDGGSQESFVSPKPGKPLSEAEVSPSAPFSGSASFALTLPRHGEWTGDLAVELPGYGRVPLTGPKIRAGLCETTACTPTLPKSLRPKTVSGKGGFKVSYFNGG